MGSPGDGDRQMAGKTATGVPLQCWDETAYWIGK